MHITPTRVALFFLTIAIAFACKKQDDGTMQPPDPTHPAGTTPIAASAQRSGDPAAGRDYLYYGDALSSGVPLDIFKIVYANNALPDLDRTGDNDGVPFKYTAHLATNGVKVASPNCLTCHAENLNGQLLVGLGNNTDDYTADQASLFSTVDALVKLFHGENSPEWEAYLPFSRNSKAIGPYILTTTQGVNPADKIFAALSVHRDKNTLEWLPTPSTTLPIQTVPTDVPAWWLMKKKNSLYYNGLGVGDFGRLSAASGLLTMQDSAEARKIDQKMVDLMAWIRTLEAPVYPQATDQTLVAEGKTIFEQSCAKCHGTYAPNAETYPNLLVNLATVGTDSSLATATELYPEHHSWYNDSWFALGTGKAQLLPNRGYVAPPLDGIWATAPYLHNGSVPTLHDLLLSSDRPTYWRRTFNNSDLDYTKMGWKHEILLSKADTRTYDTTKPGYGNGGHTFGDYLTPQQRKALIEYMREL